MVFLPTCVSLAQETNHDMNMPGVAGMKNNASTQADSMIEALEQHAISGTDAEPDSTPAAMLMHKQGNWMLMFHGEAFMNEIQQTGPRGTDKLFSTNWFMPMAQRKTTTGVLTF